MSDQILSQSRLQELLSYDQEAGLFTWRVTSSNRATAGAVAGCLDKSTGYQKIKIQGKLYRAHRLAWLYVYGEFPTNQLDHINRDRADNRICNLRPATEAENMQNISIYKNNTSGHVGVCWHKTRQKWYAHIMANYKAINLGLFLNLEDAIAARKAAELKYHIFQNPNDNS